MSKLNIKTNAKELIEPATITEEDRALIFQKTLFKFKLMKIRAKIGFIAFKKNKTINETLLTQIKNSYLELVKFKHIPINSVQNIVNEKKAYEEILNEGCGCMLKRIVQLNETKKILD